MLQIVLFPDCALIEIADTKDGAGGSLLMDVMMTSTRKIKANRQNALHSTGPTSAVGRAISSRNATCHGLLSRKLILPFEDKAEFEALLSGLVEDLAPVGMLEAHFVEQLAEAMWRKRRLSDFDAHRLNAALRAPVDLQELGCQLGFMGAAPRYFVDGPTPGPDEIQFAQQAVREFEAVPDWGNLVSDLRQLEKWLPSVSRELKTAAHAAGLNALDFLRTVAFEPSFVDGLDGYNDRGSLGKYLWGVHDRVRSLDFYAREKTRIMQAVEAQQMAAVANAAADERFVRYRAALDGEIRKILQQLRDLQRARPVSVTTAA